MEKSKSTKSKSSKGMMPLKVTGNAAIVEQIEKSVDKENTVIDLNVNLEIQN